MRALSAAMALRVPEVIGLIVQPRIVAALKAILGPDYVVIPDFHVHRNLFELGDSRRLPTHFFGIIRSGWHHDAGSEGASPYLFEAAYRMVKCGLYLQDNTVEWGGGIEIAAGGHKLPLRSSSNKLNYAAQRIWQTFKIVTKGAPLALRAGDFVAFDARLPHCGCLPENAAGRFSEAEKRAGCVRIPEQHAKLVFYFNASRACCAHTYMEYSLKRGMCEIAEIQKGARSEVFFSDFSGLRYPEDYASWLVKMLSDNGIRIAQLDAERLVKALTIRQEALASPSVLNYIA